MAGCWRKNNFYRLSLIKIDIDVLSALSCVDMIILIDDETFVNPIDILKPNIVIMSSKNNSEICIDQKLIEAYGGMICLAHLSN